MDYGLHDGQPLRSTLQAIDVTAIPFADFSNLADSIPTG